MNTATSNYSHFSDNQLVENYKRSGEKVYVGELYKRYTHLVMGMCINYFKDKELAKDAVIQIFEKLFTELKKREIENFRIWLSFVVRNYCISELRKMQTEQERITEYQYSSIQHKNETEEPENEDKQLEKLEHALNELNPFQKKCIELFYYKNMSYTEIVAITGYSANEVKSYIQNGKRNLKLILTNTK